MIIFVCLFSWLPSPLSSSSPSSSRFSVQKDDDPRCHLTKREYFISHKAVECMWKGKQTFSNIRRWGMGMEDLKRFSQPDELNYYRIRSSSSWCIYITVDFMFSSLLSLSFFSLGEKRISCFHNPRMMHEGEKLES